MTLQDKWTIISGRTSFLNKVSAEVEKGIIASESSQMAKGKQGSDQQPFAQDILKKAESPLH